MPKINILNIQPGDNQIILIDKINYNFDQILTAGGGPQGSQGQIGLTGPIGPQGIQGPAGPGGTQGSRWFVQNDAPTSSLGGVEGGNPWLGPQLGDYWLCGTSTTGYSQYGIYVYANSNGSFQWLDSGIKFSITSEFSSFDNLNAGLGLTTAVVRDSTAKDNPNFGFVLSDYWVSGSGTTSYAGTNGLLPIHYQINGENSKLKIATSSGSSTTRLISFGRADKDTINSESATYSGAYNPYIAWNNPSTQSNSTDYALNIQNPQDNINITAGATGGIFLEGDTISLDATSTYNGIFNVSGSVFTISRNPYGSGQPDTYVSSGSGTYTVTGSYINFQPGYTLGNPGNFVVGATLASSGIGGGNGIVINSASTSGNYLVLKSSASSEGQIYGGIVAESYSGTSGLAGINFSIGASGLSSNIDFKVSSPSGYQNRMSLLGNGSISFNYESGTIGSDRDVTIYIQDETINTDGANLKLVAGLSNGGNYQGGTLYLEGGGGGGNSGSSGNVVINPGTVNGSGSQLGNVYLQTNTLGQSNTSGVAIGLSEGSEVGASLVVADTNIGVTGGDILLLQKNGTSGPSTFFGFDRSGYLTNGLPYNPTLTTGLLSSDPHNLDYYEEGSWTPVLRPRGSVIGSDGTSSWSNSVYGVMKSNYTRIGDLVCVDFSINIENSLPVFNPTSGTSSDAYLYIEGFPYKPDYERTNGYSTSGGIYPVTDYINPVMPMVPIKGIGFQSNTNGTTPVGSIQAWPSLTPPAGWHICDGSQFDYAANPQYLPLYNAIGNTFDYGTITGTFFKIPDLRGYFIRGLNEVSPYGDPSKPDSGRSLGSVQADSYEKHQHYVPTGGDNSIDDNDRTPTNNTSNGYIQGRNNPDSRVNPSNNPRTDHPEKSDGTNYGAANVPGDTVDFRDPTLSGFPANGLWMNHFTCESGIGTETRPVNMSLNYIIYVGVPDSSTAIQEFSGSFIEESGNTNMYIYNFNGNLSTSSIPSVGNKYIYGSFSYFTNSIVP